MFLGVSVYLWGEGLSVCLWGMYIGSINLLGVRGVAACDIEHDVLRR